MRFSDSCDGGGGGAHGTSLAERDAEEPRRGREVAAAVKVRGGKKPAADSAVAWGTCGAS